MCPNTSRFYGKGGEAPKVVVHFRILKKRFRAVVYFRIIRKRDSNFFAAAVGLRIETNDLCLIRARKIAQLVGSDRRKQKPYLQRNHRFSRFGR